MKKKESILLEKLAELEHIQWMNWTKNVLENEKISKTTIQRWKGYLIPYNELPEEIKELDRNYARKVLNIINLEQ